MIEPNENTYTDDQAYKNSLDGYDFIEEQNNIDGDSDYFDAIGIVEDIDFSEIRGKDFKSSLQKVNKVFAKKKSQKQPLSKDFYVKKRATLWGKNEGGGTEQTTKRIIVPNTQKIIVEGVDKFILGDDKCGAKDIGYYNCKKLKELVFTLDNNSLLDFNLNLFDPSMPLNYLFSTSGNLNNKITVAGGVVSYSDVMFNILANPMHIVNAKFTFGGPFVANQINQPLIFKNKSATGEQKVEPFQLQLEVDNMQVAKDIVFFKLDTLNRPFIPNGMDIIQYKVLAGNTVTFAFYYRQKDIRRLFYEEARNTKKLL
jgi:hypothetical protein